MRIAICGAGLGGLTAALALADRGFEVTVYEQADRLGEVGAGLQLSANATRVLYELGLREPLLAAASIPEGKQVRLWNSGKAWKLFDLGPVSEERYGYPYLMLHRADLHTVLVEALQRRRPGALVLGRRLEAFEEGSEGVTLRFADGSTATADLMIGADGVHSVTRTQLFGDSDPSFSGCVAWRGVVPAGDLPDHLRSPLGTNWIGPHGHVIHYPVRGGEMINFVGIVERGDWAVESWNHPGAVSECAADFAGWHEDVQTLIGSLSAPMKWALMLRSPLENWSSQRVTLLGDACHPTLPFLAQGACMAIEDGLVLARALDARPDDPAAAFKSYENARVERTTAIVRGSAANAGRFHNPTLADAETADAYVAEEWSEERVAQRYEWLFQYDAAGAPV
ncbi:FAD-dependent monooxygenase [Streptomyces fuscichromogenes]|uniref:FAD-dependent monooxygenase n=1 Tax=Streptomyces fuscichromogenes TaxID=1324013 RepID=UPI0038139A4C